MTGTLPGGGWRDDNACLAYAGVPVTFIKPVGDAKLFEVTTNLGVRKIVAPDAAAARRIVEER